MSSNGRYIRNSINLGLISEQVVLREGDFISNLDGDWLVLVRNRESHTGEFTLNTTLATDQGNLISSQTIQLDIVNQFWPPIVRLAWPSVSGENYILESSENLVDWLPVFEKTAGADGMVFRTGRSWYGDRYYRVKQVLDSR